MPRRKIFKKCLPGFKHSVPPQPSSQHFFTPGHSSSTEHCEKAGGHSGLRITLGHLPAVSERKLKLNMNASFTVVQQIFYS